jgi:hypothetical protein
MTIEDDAEWLRAELHTEGFHSQYSQKWVAARDSEIVHATTSRNDMQKWLDENDKNLNCVLAFGDWRIIV